MSSTLSVSLPKGNLQDYHLLFVVCHAAGPWLHSTPAGHVIIWVTCLLAQLLVHLHSSGACIASMQCTDLHS